MDKPLMQRRHFEFIAEVLRSLPERMTRDAAVNAFADALRATNANFDRGRFQLRCLPAARDRAA